MACMLQQGIKQTAGSIRAGHMFLSRSTPGNLFLTDSFATRTAFTQVGIWRIQV